MKLFNIVYQELFEFYDWMSDINMDYTEIKTHILTQSQKVGKEIYQQLLTQSRYQGYIGKDIHNK